MAVTDDHILAALFAGFSIGFGWFTVWEAIQQTRRIRNPLRSTYIYMVWGEIVSNIPIGVLGWLLLDGVLPPSLPVLFMVLFFWVFETQLQPQIIINRIGIIAESQKTVTWVKWCTVAFVSLINISVFVIWIPSHVQPPPSDKNLLGCWFVHVVKQRLVKQHRLVKYKPLIGFTNWMMLISILMDICLVVLLSLPNEMVYIQFHPCAYLVKLHIEMTMANLITRLARGQPANDFEDEDRYGLSSQSQRARNTYHNYLNGPQLSSGAKDIEMVVGPASKPSTGTATSNSTTTPSQTKESAIAVTANSGTPPQRSARPADITLPPRYEESNRSSSLGLPHHHATMSQDRNNTSSSRRASRRPSLTNSVPGLGRTRYGYGDDEVSLTSNAGQTGWGEEPPEPSPQTKKRHEDWERSGTPVPFVLGRGPTPMGSRRPSVTR
ncbi:hypothetical protein PG985_007546 [Apiospora marii]|uniref:uncharacterized protein n=1 Tax=Apiospora marii TaxID=335849 RepID=UPI00312E40A9